MAISLPMKLNLYTRVSLYHQESSGDKGYGKLATQELYPGLDAAMLIVGYKF